MPTNGNAGAAWSTYAARAGLRATLAMPVDAPRITRAEIVVTGGDLRLVDGLISDAGRLIGAAVAASSAGWFDVSTLKEPYRIEGKKTMGFEIAEQLGWRMPDVIVYPTGGGVGLIGIHKALLEARRTVHRVCTHRRGVRSRCSGIAAVARLRHDRVRHQRAEGAR
jgi:threonine synthase